MVAPHASDDFGLPSAMLGPGAATGAKLRPEGGSIDRRPPVTASRPARRRPAPTSATATPDSSAAPAPRLALPRTHLSCRPRR